MTNNQEVKSNKVVEFPKLARMRTVDQAYKMLKEEDEGTQISRHLIRQLLNSGVIPFIPCGKKKLLNYDLLLEIISNPTQLSEFKYEYSSKRSKATITKSKFEDVKPITI